MMLFLHLKIVNISGYLSIIVATPITEESATIPTPTSSPAIILNVLLSPMLIPRLIDRAIHIPGVSDTRKNVGIKITNIDKFKTISKKAHF